MGNMSSILLGVKLKIGGGIRVVKCRGTKVHHSVVTTRRLDALFLHFFFSKLCRRIDHFQTVNV